MCSQGPSGLDDLHSATNEFLGHFVDVVYKHRGDGKIFCTNWTFYGFLDIVYLTDLIFDFTLSLTFYSAPILPGPIGTLHLTRPL